MLRRLALLLPVVAASSGCFDFDSAYAQFCDGGRCSSSGGGAAAGGGSAGGGSATGGGGATGGGSGRDSGTPDAGRDAGPVDAGCPDFLCPQLDWMSPRASIFFTVAPGLLTQSLDRFTVVASFEARAPGSNNFSHFEYRFVDGGVSAINRTPQLSTNTETTQLRGLSLSDYFITYRTYSTRFENGAIRDYQRCQALDGGETDPYHYAVLPVTPDEAWFVGWPQSICRWTRDAGLVATNEPDVTSRDYYLDAYLTASGELYVVGGRNDFSQGVAVGIIVKADGSPVQADPVVDTWYDDGYASIDGVGDTVYALARSNATQQGEIHQLQADGTFQRVYTAPFRLAKLDVMSTGEVWAAGAAPDRVVYFDGGTWADLPLPVSPMRTELTWENINATEDGQGIVLSGNERQEDGGRTAVVNTFRRFRK